MTRRMMAPCLVLCTAVMGVAGASSALGGTVAASGCAQPSPPIPTHQGWAPAALTLAPAGATSVRVCRYSGLNAHPRLRLTAGALIRDRSKVDQVVWRLDRLPSGPPGPVACPSDDLSQIEVVLGYPGRHSVAVSVGLAGCETATNGAVYRTAAGVPGQPEPRLIAWLNGLTRPRPPSLDSAAMVVRDRWTAEKPALLGERVDAAAVWDGRELLVVGGAPVTRPGSNLTSGAAYDPNRARWRPIASAPLPISVADATVWTGHSLFVLPAAASGASAPVRAALYDPALNRWAVTRPAPTGPLIDPLAVRSGRLVIVTGLSPSTPGVVRGVAYDPGAGTWTPLDLRLPADHPADSLELATTPAGVLLWSLWSRTEPAGPGSFTIAAGVDVFRRNDSGSWTDVTAGWPQNHTVDDPTPAGSRLLLAPGQIWCGPCPHPAPFGEHGVAVDPVTLRRTSLPHGPLDDLGPQIVWTGAAEVAINGVGAESGSAGRVDPGDIAVLDLRTRRWARGARAPDALQLTPPVWAEHRLLAFAVDGRLLVDGPPRSP